jgi:FlaA1/EpsC-like NDP-sugar epimerase
MCKAVTEKLYLDFANRIQASSRHPKLSVGIVRYGNVLNSAGSIIPFFLEKIRKGETELPITDERMTRFLISLPAAVELIDWTITNEIHAQIVVPKLKGFRVLDVASALTETPVTFKYIGIRAGEKLHEDLISDSEGFFTKDAGAYYLIGNKYQNSEVLGYRSDNCLSSKQDLIEMLKRENII